MPYLEPHRVDLIELDELRHTADLLDMFLSSVRPDTVGQAVIDAAEAELTIIYGQIEPYTFLPY